eukprot:tig00000403_g302.t1
MFSVLARRGPWAAARCAAYSAPAVPPVLERADVLRLLEQKPPFLYVDRCVENVYGKRVKALRTVLPEEVPFEQMLLVEAIAQAGSLIVRQMPEYARLLPVFSAMKDVQFSGLEPATGDELVVDAELLGVKARKLGVLTGSVHVRERLACKGTIWFSFVDLGTFAGAAGP